MIEQEDLFSAPYQKHSPTSKAAAHAIEPKSHTLRRKVLDFIKVAPRYGATDEEIQIALEMEGSTERPRRIELLEQGLIKDSGKTRETRKGRQATVWVAV